MKTMQAELSNPKHSEYGVATIPFPIPDEEYDHVLELLEPLEIGDYVERDCQVDRLIGVPPILHRLEQTLVNLDELDFLIQRLDSFDYYEMEQFQALAYAKGVSNVLELINLTFNCQQVTVVGNFADLDAAGKQHYLTIHGGSASVEEYNRVDGRQESLNLLCNQEGKVTPYGVLYENALKMEQFYDGRNFPLYAYKPPVLEVTLSSNAGQELELLLPMPETRLERMLCRAGMDTAHVNLVSYESQLPDELDAAIDFETDDLKSINAVCRSLSALDTKQISKLAAVTELAKPMHAGELLQLAENVEQFEFFPGVKSSEEYGRYMIQESGHFEYDPNLEDFYDYEGYAQSRMAEYQGKFTSRGYVNYTGAMPLDELMRDEAAEQSFQMGGLKYCKSQSEFVEKALCFYIGYLNAEDAADFLPRTFATTMRGLLGTYGDRMGSLLFKVAVEQNIANNLLAADMELDEATYQRLRGRCVQQVQSTNGRVTLQDAIQFQRKV